MYEPWQLYDKDIQYLLWEPGYLELINTHLPKGLKKLSIFEDFNETLIALIRARQDEYPEFDPDLVRVATPDVGAAFATRSLKLEQLSVSFIADAYYFFEARKPQWRWDHLQSLTLTSRLMNPRSEAQSIKKMLQRAGEAAIFMPKLHTMTLWNGAREKLAHLPIASKMLLLPGEGLGSSS